MFAIYKRELKSYFCSFIGLLFIAVTLFFVSLYFLLYNLYQGYPYITYAISSVLFLFLISVPVLSMRVLAEERRSKTDQLILTSPVSVGGIVAGKFLALLTVFAIPTAIVCTYPLLMSRFGTVPMAENYLAILAFFLYGMASIAVGVLISSLTESQVIAAVVCFIVLFIGYMMDGLCSLISQTENLFTKVLGLFDMATPFTEMLNGTLNLKSVLYFLLLTGFALFLTVQSIQKRRYSTSVKNLSLTAYSTGAIALAAALIAAVNLVVSEMPSTWTSWDITQNQLYSLTDQSKEYLKTLTEDVTIYVLSSEDGQDTTLGQTLAIYDELSDHVTVEYVDPSVNPRFYTQYTDQTSYNSLIVVSDKRNKVIDYGDIYVTDYSYDYDSGSYSADTTGYDAEGQITSAIGYVLSDDMPKLYLTDGHGEESLTSTFTDALKKENVDYETLRLMDCEQIPEDAAALVIYSATSDFSEDDRDKVISYLDRGGKVIYIAGYAPEEEFPNLSAVLEHMGLSVAEGLVVETDQSCYYRNPFYLLPTIGYSSYTTGLNGNYYIFAPYVQGIMMADRDDISFDAFLTTSNSAYSKTDTGNAQELSKTEDDIDGPFAVGVAAQKETEEGDGGLLVAFGCSQIFTDSANNMVSGANRMLFGNTVSAFAQKEVSVSIPAKSYEVNYLTVSEQDVVLWGILTVVLIPAGCLIAGFVIWFQRRKR